MKKILYQIKNHVKYLFKRNIDAYCLAKCDRLLYGGYLNGRTFIMVEKKYYKNREKED